ncbi:MAG: aspartate racemase [Candidatus Latescibacterota bacterium]|jgi:aspartate racemase
MKTIGLIGGMSWESTELYYRWINEGIKEHLGGLHSARIVLVSVNFQEIELLQREGDWDRAAELLAAAARSVEMAGADVLLVCTNTMHKVAPQVAAAVSIPLLHLADATAVSIEREGIKGVGLLGTRFTMEEDFYKSRLLARSLDVIVPDASDREIVHRVIYDELCLGEIKDASRQEYLRIIGGLKERGAECVVLGCTEITLLIEQQHTNMPLFDTTAIHARAAVEYAVS